MSGSQRRRSSRRRTGSTARRYKPSELVPASGTRRTTREAIFASIAVSIVCAALIALIWVMTDRSIEEHRAVLRSQVEQAMQAQAGSLAENARLELATIDQTLAILAAAWTKDPEGFRLSDFQKDMPALTRVSDDIFLADNRNIIQQDILPQAVGQGVGSAYLPIPQGSLEQFDQDGNPRDGKMITPTTAPPIDGRRSLIYLARPLGEPPRFVLGASWRSAELPRHYALADLGFNGMAALIETGRGFVVGIAGPAARRPRMDASKSEMFEAMRKPERGTWIGPSSVDGVIRIHGFQKVPRRDLLVVVATPYADAMGPAEDLVTATRSVAVIASGIVVIVGGIVLWGLAKRREIRRRKREFERAVTDLEAARIDLALARGRGGLSAARLRGLLDGTTDAVAVFDPDLKLAAWNHRFEIVSGLPAKDLREGLPLDEMLRIQCQTGIFGPQPDDEAEVARRVIALTTTDDPLDLTQAGPEGTPLPVRRLRLPESGLLMLLGGLQNWSPPAPVIAHQPPPEPVAAPVVAAPVAPPMPVVARPETPPPSTTPGTSRVEW